MSHSGHGLCCEAPLDRRGWSSLVGPARARSGFKEIYRAAALWALAIRNTGTFYFLTTWLPRVLHSSGILLTRSGLAMTYFQVGGTLCGLSIARPLDQVGLMPVRLLFPLAIPSTCSIGYAALWSETALMVAMFLAAASGWNSASMPPLP